MQARPLLCATLLLAATLGAGAALALQSRNDPRQAYGSKGPIPPDDSPEIKAAIERTRRMVDALRNNGWRFGRDAQRLQNLPAQAHMEDPGDRDPARSAFAVPSPPGRYPYEEIATYSDVYVRKNIVHRGDGATLTPTGFYLVGWRDGRVETAPVDRAKTVVLQGGSRALLFPGVKERPIDHNAP